MTLTNPKTISFVGYPKVIPYTKFEHFGIIRLSYAANKQINRQTDAQTDADERFTVVGVSNDEVYSPQRH